MQDPSSTPGALKSGGARTPARLEGAGHRLLVVDASPPWAAGRKSDQRLVLVDTDACSVVASVEAGGLPDAAISPDGSLVAVISDRGTSKPMRRENCLTIYDARTLGVKKVGILPSGDKPRRFPLLTVMDVFGFSPDGSTVFVPSMTDPTGQIAARAAQPELLFYVPIRWGDELDAEGKYRIAADFKVTAAPFSGLCPVLATRRWPQVEIADRRNRSIQVVDFGRGGLASAYRISGLAYPGQPEKLSGNPGYCFGTSSGLFAYLVPEPEDPGRLIAIDLSSGRPVVRAKSHEVHADLAPSLAAAGLDRTGKIYVAPMMSPAPDRVEIFSGDDLRPLGRIELGGSFLSMCPSKDGSRLYAAGQGPPSVKVIDLDAPNRIRQVEGGLKWPLAMVAS
jgi:hypothetical protein